MHIILAVTNDISTDQRVIRTVHSLQKMKASTYRYWQASFAYRFRFGSEHQGYTNEAFFQ